MSEIIKEVQESIAQYEMIQKGDHIIVGVSGGPDSMCMLHILKGLQETYKIKLYAVHLNHCFRGADADADMDYVEKICKQWDIPVYIEKINVPAYSAKMGLSPEEAGRKLRYELYDKVYKEVGGSKIAVAQNLNDNAETVLMRLMRGTGLNGIKGIEPVRDNIIRPLIHVERSLIEKYCEEQQIHPCIDKTNAEPIYARNKIRIELLPYMKNHFNPNITYTLNQFAQIMTEENEYVEQQGKKIFSKVAILEEETVKINIAKMRAEHIAMQKRILLQGIRHILGDTTGIEQKHIALALKLVEKNTGAAIELPFHLKIFKSYDTIIIQRKKTVKMHEIQNEIIKMNIKPIKVANMSKIERSEEKIWIDAEQIKEDLVLRHRKPGDIFSPIGMKGSKKLSTYMVDEKIPKEQRDEIDVIADGNNIVWVVGKRMSEQYKVRNHTKNIYEINISRGKTNGK